jgi:hypothetical protein
MTEPTAPNQTDLYQVAARQWQAATTRGVVDDDIAWFQTADNRQLAIEYDADTDTFHVDPIDFTSRRLGNGCWVDRAGSTGGTVNDPSDDDTAIPDPGELAAVLATTLPMPIAGPLYGFQRRDGQTTTLIHLWQADDGADEMRHACFALPGVGKPAQLHTDGGDRADFLNLAAWWQAVDAGRIACLDEAVAGSAQPVEMRRHQGFYEYVLVRGREAWTGVDGPALYLHDTAGDITAERALRWHGTDIRKMTRAALDADGN